MSDSQIAYISSISPRQSVRQVCLPASCPTLGITSRCSPAAAVLGARNNPCQRRYIASVPLFRRLFKQPGCRVVQVIPHEFLHRLRAWATRDIGYPSAKEEKIVASSERTGKSTAQSGCGDLRRSARPVGQFSQSDSRGIRAFREARTALLKLDLSPRPPNKSGRPGLAGAIARTCDRHQGIRKRRPLDNCRHTWLAVAPNGHRHQPIATSFILARWPSRLNRFRIPHILRERLSRGSNLAIKLPASTPTLAPTGTALT